MKKAVVLIAVVFALGSAVCRAAIPESPKNNAALKPLRKVKDRIVWESYRKGNWELMIMDADGSNPRNLTNTPDINESYPQCSPDGKLIAFECCDNTTGAAKRIEIMNPDGTGRRRIIDNARQMAWSPDGTRLAYCVPDPTKRAKDLSIYDLRTGTSKRWDDGKTTITLIGLDGKETRIASSELFSLHTPAWSRDGRWIACSIAAAMGFSQSIILIEVDGDRVYDWLHQSHETTGGILGCRPNFSDDGTMLTWAVADMNKLMWIDTAPIDMSASVPKIGEHRHMIRCEVPEEFYHADWSPDGRFIAFTHGVRGNRMRPAYGFPGVKAPGWDICIVDTEHPDQYTQITHDGLSNKEPDWLKSAF
ncbi:MAG: hypothetical protein ABFD69_04055 [Candidatus Sumerlaeia bacterium]